MTHRRLPVFEHPLDRVRWHIGRESDLCVSFDVVFDVVFLRTAPHDIFSGPYSATHWPFM